MNKSLRPLSMPLTLGIAVVAFLAFVSPIAAQSCGDFVNYSYEYDEVTDQDYIVEVREPIEDCANPFNADVPDPFTYTLTIANTNVTSGTVVTIPVGESLTRSFTIDIESSGGFPFKQLVLFRKEGADYYRLENDDSYTYNLTNPTGGEYVAALTYTELFLNQESPWWMNLLRNIFGVVAHAYFPDYELVVVVPFSVVVEEPAPEGASSVLFLPGIKASRLYMEENGRENQLWNPGGNADVLKLSMDSTGTSINNVYTNDIIESVGTLNFYKDFIKELEKLKSVEKAIKEYTAFAYDWRYSVFDVATMDIPYPNGEFKNLKEEVERLAAESYTGKVTLIGHSNGGLVAKALLHEYGDNELAGKVDKIIMIGTPQLGTPQAIGTLLHGYREELIGGLLTSASASRKAIRNMSGAYGLLPSNQYFKVTDNELVVTTDNSSITGPIRSYGDITNSAQLRNFLTDSLDQFPEEARVNTPVAANVDLITQNLSYQDVLDNWIPPEGVAVYEVVGTGLPTIKGFRYRALGCAGLVACLVPSQLKPFPIPTNYGDGVVVGNSAEAFEGNKTTFYIDLKQAGAGLARNFSHEDLTENNSVQNFVISSVKYGYLTGTLVGGEFSSIFSRYTLIGGHSPITIRATSDTGKVGIFDNQLFQEVPGSKYFTLGDSTYLVLPSDEEYSVEILGTGEGVFALTIDQLLEDDTVKKLSYLNSATTTSTMVSTFTLHDTEIGNLHTDYENDGIVDLVKTPNGETVNPEPPILVKYDYSDLESAIKNLELKRGLKNALLVKVNLANNFSKRNSGVFKKLEEKTLNSILKIIKAYNKNRLISDNDSSDLKKIIENLHL